MQMAEPRPKTILITFRISIELGCFASEDLVAARRENDTRFIEEWRETREVSDKPTERQEKENDTRREIKQDICMARRLTLRGLSTATSASLSSVHLNFLTTAEDTVL